MLCTVRFLTEVKAFKLNETTLGPVTRGLLSKGLRENSLDCLKKESQFQSYLDRKVLVCLQSSIERTGCLRS